MKYESETGESMEKPGKKLKKLLIITGTTGAVYAGSVSYTHLDVYKRQCLRWVPAERDSTREWRPIRQERM